jgi:D-isomer specific 2-hydroxyacid dehydrogenase, NAD binding domain
VNVPREVTLPLPVRAHARRRSSFPAQCSDGRRRPDQPAARGGTVDESARATAPKSGELGGAALGVFEAKPLTAAGAILQNVPNLILTPRIVGVTDESNVRVSAVTAHAALEVLAAS